MMILESAIILVLLLAAIIIPRHEFEVPASAFDDQQSPQVTVDHTGLTVIPAADTASEQLNLIAYGINLRPGAYEICVNYDSDTDGRGDFYARGATFTLDSNRNITTDYINLNDAQTKAYGRVWVPLSLKGTTNVAACVSYLGKGTVSLFDVTLTEIVGYRFVCIAVLALALFALHVLHAGQP